MIAVLGMFNPILLGITDNNHYVIQEGLKSLPEDPYDEEFLRETSVTFKHIFYTCYLYFIKLYILFYFF